MKKAENSNIDAGNVSSFSEGAGKFFAALGKEVDEHDAVGKLSSAGATAIKLKSIGEFILVIVVVLFIALTAIPLIFAKRPSTTSKTIDNYGDSKRIVTEGDVREYQVKDSSGNWYRVNESEFNNIK